MRDNKIQDEMRGCIPHASQPFGAQALNVVKLLASLERLSLTHSNPHPESGQAGVVMRRPGPPSLRRELISPSPSTLPPRARAKMASICTLFHGWGGERRGSFLSATRAWLWGLRAIRGFSASTQCSPPSNHFILKHTHSL